VFLQSHFRNVFLVGHKHSQVVNVIHSGPAERNQQWNVCDLFGGHFHVLQRLADPGEAVCSALGSLACFLEFTQSES